MTSFIEKHRDVFGVGPIWRVLQIAPSTYYERKAVERDPDLASDRAKQDKEDSREIRHIFDASGGWYGTRKVWNALRRVGHDIARCKVERLIKAMGLKGPFQRCCASPVGQWLSGAEE